MIFKMVSQSQDHRRRARGDQVPNQPTPSELPARPASRLASPSWLDLRLLLGIALVLSSVVVGAKLLASADRYQQVWMATRDVSAGSVLSKDDLSVAEVRFRKSASSYIAIGGRNPAGMRLVRPVLAGELLPREAVADGEPDEVRLLTVPVQRFHLPKDLRSGIAVDVYVTPKAEGGVSEPPRLVLNNVIVDGTVNDSTYGGAAAGGTIGVVLRVAEEEALPVIAAMQEGALHLVRIPVRTAVS
jgi:Flp pilus assembly protein CpaB